MLRLEISLLFQDVKIGDVLSKTCWHSVLWNLWQRSSHIQLCLLHLTKYLWKTKCKKSKVLMSHLYKYIITWLKFTSSYLCLASLYMYKLCLCLIVYHVCYRRPLSNKIYLYIFTCKSYLLGNKVCFYCFFLLL